MQTIVTTMKKNRKRYKFWKNKKIFFISLFFTKTTKNINFLNIENIQVLIKIKKLNCKILIFVNSIVSINFKIIIILVINIFNVYPHLCLNNYSLLFN